MTTSNKHRRAPWLDVPEPAVDGELLPFPSAARAEQVTRLTQSWAYRSAPDAERSIKRFVEQRRSIHLARGITPDRAARDCSELEATLRAGLQYWRQMKGHRHDEFPAA